MARHKTHSQIAKSRRTWNAGRKKASRSTYTNISHAPTLGIRKRGKNQGRKFF